MNPLTCKNCSRKFIDRYFDKCMYCGHPIPVEHRLSKSEKDIIKFKKEKQAEEQRDEHERFMAKHKESMRRPSSDFDPTASSP
jgi:hypothetical protein